MGLDFSKFAPPQDEVVATQTAEASVTSAAETVVVENSSETDLATIPETAQNELVASKDAAIAELANSPEVEALVSTIEVHNMESIVKFGAEAAEEISKVSDSVLRGVDMNSRDETGKLLKVLTNIMNKFDVQEFKGEPSLLEKIFGRKGDTAIDRLLAKYHSMGDEVDKIYVQLRTYEDDIKKSNRDLNAMYDANVNYYRDLLKYILAGDKACEEIKAYMVKREADMAQSGDTSIQLELQSLSQSLLMLEQRVQDLRVAENVAMQSIPMLKMQELTNYNLVRKINSSFIVTLPLFKQELAQAVLLKQQKMQAESLSALDEKTNELLLKNAKNTVETTKLTTKLASGSSVKIETLEATWKAIMDGIDQTRAIDEAARKKRIEDKKRLEVIKEEFNNKFLVSQIEKK